MFLWKRGDITGKRELHIPCLWGRYLR